MSEILDKNLKFIRKSNELLADKILAVSEFTKQFELNTNFVGEYNLLINGIPVHSLMGAEQEANDIVDKQTQFSSNTINVLFGLGLGYLYDALSHKSKGKIIIFEPDVELLRFVLDTVDFSVEFAKGNTFIVSDCSQLEQALKNIYYYKVKVSLFALDYYINKESVLYDEAGKCVDKSCRILSLNHSFQAKMSHSFLLNAVDALYKRFNMPLINDYKDVLKGKPALVVSAGPSLSANIEYIKKHRDKFVVFCVGTALKALLDNGVVPDFLNIIETRDTTIHYNFPQTKDMFLVCEPYTNSKVLERDYKKIFISASDETEVNRWFLEKRNQADAKFETKGTVAYQAIFSAYTLGCSPIVLVGQDLAYPNGQCYTKGSFFDSLKCVYDNSLGKYVITTDDYEKFKNSYFHQECFTEEFKETAMKDFLQKENENLRTVKGQKGEFLPTSSMYETFISYITGFGLRYHDKVKLYNCSTGGAQLDFFENSDIDSVVNKHNFTVLDKETLFSSLYIDKDIDRKYLINSLKEECKICNMIVEMMDESIASVDKLNNEIQSINCVTDKLADYTEVVIRKYLGILSGKMSRSKISACVCAEQIGELTYWIKEYLYKPDVESISCICEQLNILFKSQKDNLKTIISRILEVVKQLEDCCESSCTEG